VIRTAKEVADFLTGILGSFPPELTVMAQADRFCGFRPGHFGASAWPFEKGYLMTKMESQTQQDEPLPSVTFVATAPTDEVLIAAAKSGESPSLFGTMDAPLESSIQDSLWDHRKARRCRGRDSGCVDESLSAFEHFRGQGEICDLGHTHCDQFVADDSAKETFSPSNFSEGHGW
jgi:hypothetical protein